MPPLTITETRTPGHQLPYLFPGQTQKEAFVNEGFARLDALVQAVVLEERELPPQEPAPGACYLIAETPGGVWADHAGSLAVWTANQWLFLPPRQGAQIYDLARGALLRFGDTSGWQGVAAPALPAGGVTQDDEARTAIAGLVAALRDAGVFYI